MNSQMMANQVSRIDSFLSKGDWDEAINQCEESLRKFSEIKRNGGYPFASGVEYDLSRKLFKASVMAHQSQKIILKYISLTKECAIQITNETWQYNDLQIREVSREIEVMDYLISILRRGEDIKRYFVHPFPGQAEPGYKLDYRKNPDSPRLNTQSNEYFNGSIDLLNMGRYAEALNYANKALELDPFMYQAFNTRASALKALGRDQDAVISYIQGLKIKPDDDIIKDNLLSLLFLNFSEKSEKLFNSLSMEDRRIVENLTKNINKGNSLSKSNIELTKSGKTDCFIATATFGSPTAKEVVFYRNFRDKYLLNYSMGKLFISFYYNSLGPSLASLIKRSELLKLISLYLLKGISKLLPEDCKEK